MTTKFHGLLLKNMIQPIDKLADLCQCMIDDKQVLDWEKNIYAFILEWIDDKDYIVQRSSGTSGIPKEIKLSKESMIKSAENTCNFFEFKFGQSALLCLPIEYIAGKMMIVRAFVGGLNLLYTEPSSFPDISNSGNIDFCAMVPLQVYNILNSAETLRKIRKIIIGGAEIRDELEVLLRDLPNEVYATYGMAETCSHVAIRRLSGSEFERHYHALPGIKFSSDKRNCLLIDTDYLTDQVVTNDVIDLLNPETFRWIGRYDNLINSGGIKIVPEEIEAVVSKTTGFDCAIVGMPDEKLGQRVVLIIEKGGGEISQEEVKSSLISELPKRYHPKEIIFVDELPRNHSFKVDRKKLLASIL